MVSSSNLDRSYDSSSYRSFGASNVVCFDDIQVNGFCSKTKSISLVNTTNRLVEMPMWRLCGYVDGVEMFDYKFTRNAVIWPDQQIKVELNYAILKSFKRLILIFVFLNAKALERVCSQQKRQQSNGLYYKVKWKRSNQIGESLVIWFQIIRDDSLWQKQ